MLCIQPGGKPVPPVNRVVILFSLLPEYLKVVGTYEIGSIHQLSILILVEPAGIHLIHCLSYYCPALGCDYAPLLGSQKRSPGTLTDIDRLPGKRGKILE